MNRWRRSIWQIGALLALLASASPKLVWACPVTGRIGDAALVRESKTPSGALCASPGGKCCKSLPLPPLPNGQFDSAHDLSGKPIDFFSGALLSSVAQRVNDGPNVAPIPVPPRHLAPDLRETSRVTTSLPPFLALNRPAPQAGRAPPFMRSSTS